MSNFVCNFWDAPQWNPPVTIARFQRPTNNQYIHHQIFNYGHVQHEKHLFMNHRIRSNQGTDQTTNQIFQPAVQQHSHQPPMFPPNFADLIIPVNQIYNQFDRHNSNFVPRVPTPKVHKNNNKRKTPSEMTDIYKNIEQCVGITPDWVKQMNYKARNDKTNTITSVTTESQKTKTLISSETNTPEAPSSDSGISEISSITQSTKSIIIEHNHDEELKTMMGLKKYCSKRLEPCNLETQVTGWLSSYQKANLNFKPPPDFTPFELLEFFILNEVPVCTAYKNLMHYHLGYFDNRERYGKWKIVINFKTYWGDDLNMLARRVLNEQFSKWMMLSELSILKCLIANSFIVSGSQLKKCYLFANVADDTEVKLKTKTCSRTSRKLKSKFNFHKILRAQTSPRFYTAKFAQYLHENQLFGMVIVRKDKIEVKIESEVVSATCWDKDKGLSAEIETTMFECCVQNDSLNVCGDLFKKCNVSDNSVGYRSLGIILESSVSELYEICQKEYIFVEKIKPGSGKVYAEEQDFKLLAEIINYPENETIQI